MGHSQSRPRPRPQQSAYPPPNIYQQVEPEIIAQSQSAHPGNGKPADCHKCHVICSTLVVSNQVLRMVLSSENCNLQGNNQFYGQDPQQMNNGHYRGGWHGPQAYPPMFPPVRYYEDRQVTY